MALPTSGPLSIQDIRTELNDNSSSLRYLSSLAGFSSPDSISEFYGYSNSTNLYLYLGIASIGSYNNSFRLSTFFSETYSTDTYLYVFFEYTVYNYDYGYYQDSNGFTFGPFSSGVNPTVSAPINPDDGFIDSVDNVYGYYFQYGTGSDLNIVSFNY